MTTPETLHHSDVTLIELIASTMNKGRWFVTVWRGMRMECELEFITFAGVVAYLESRKSGSGVA